MAVGGIGKAAFHQMSAPQPVAPGRPAVALGPGRFEFFMPIHTQQPSTVLGAGALGP
jgi:hypothetical protein